MRIHLRTTTLAIGVALVTALALACTHKPTQQAPEPVHVSGQAEPEPVVETQPVSEKRVTTPAPAKSAAKRVASLGASSSGRSR